MWKYYSRWFKDRLLFIFRKWKNIKWGKQIEAAERGEGAEVFEVEICDGVMCLF
jgi:hypothetical protein